MSDQPKKTAIDQGAADEELTADRLHVETEDKAGKLRLFGNSGAFDFNRSNDYWITYDGNGGRTLHHCGGQSFPST